MIYEVREGEAYPGGGAEGTGSRVRDVGTSRRAAGRPDLCGVLKPTVGVSESASRVIIVEVGSTSFSVAVFTHSHHTHARTTHTRLWRLGTEERQPESVIHSAE